MMDNKLFVDPQLVTLYIKQLEERMDLLTEECRAAREMRETMLEMTRSQKEKHSGGVWSYEQRDAYDEACKATGDL